MIEPPPLIQKCIGHLVGAVGIFFAVLAVIIRVMGARAISSLSILDGLVIVK